MTDNTGKASHIVAFAQALVRTPSRAQEDDPAKIVSVISEWANDNGLSFNKMFDDNGKALGGYFHYSSGKPGPSICLDACIDTCSFGAIDSWQDSPTSGKIENDYLHGRGAADAKMGVSIFCHLFQAITQEKLDKGDLYLLLDADEHTGNFGGVKAFLKLKNKIDIAFIGYPGSNEIMRGARGFLRATISVHGQGAHSGSRKPSAYNAIVRAARLIDDISSAPLPQESDPSFSFGPKVTITAINGGQAFSQVPDKVDINVDMRLTPAFEGKTAADWLQGIVAAFDRKDHAAPASSLDFTESWPAYAISPTAPAAAKLKEHAEAAFRHPVDLAVCGPSNIGNLLAAHNIPAICGFGVEYDNAHAPNERAKISTVDPVYSAYYRTIRSLCS